MLRRYEETERKIIFLLLSFFIHLSIILLLNTHLPAAVKHLLQLKKKVKPREKVVYVKILNVPKPEKPETPKEKNTPIISQYTMRKKGPKGKQEKSILSGESQVLQPQPGLPFKLKPVIPKTESAEKGRSGQAKKEQTAKKKISKFAKKAEKSKKKSSEEKQKKGQEKKEEKIKVAMKTPPSKSSPIIPPLPERKIPLIDPRLVSKEAKRIVPQMGEGESVEISLDTMESKYISYFKHIRDKIYLVWIYPDAAKSAGIQGVVKILFVIDRSGRLKEVRILESSGYSVLDKEAIRALYAAAPFGPFPSDWKEKELRIRARFIYHLFRRSPF